MAFEMNRAKTGMNLPNGRGKKTQAESRDNNEISRRNLLIGDCQTIVEQ
jgi:hypothetical protein